MTDFAQIEEQIKFNNYLLTGKPFMWYTQKVLFKTHLYGRDYYWMQDHDGTTYLAKIGENGLPDLS